jgi:hypothetical protein
MSGGLHVLPAARRGDVLAWTTARRLEPGIVPRATTKHDLLRATAHALDFPGYARPNWDSVEECLRDLSWLPAARRVLVVDGASALARAEPDTWTTALSVFDGAVRVHAAGDAPLFVFAVG